MNEITCRGSMALGTGCGKCSRCRAYMDGQTQWVSEAFARPTHLPCKGCKTRLTYAEAAFHKCYGNPLGSFEGHDEALDQIREEKRMRDEAQKVATAVMGGLPSPGLNTHAKQGWQCPLCKVVHAPDVRCCTCQSNGMTVPNPIPQPMTCTSDDAFKVGGTD